MIKITNLNFQNQTIESIEVNGETVDNLEIKLTKTKFNIVIVKDNKIIKKEIKKKDNIVDVVIEEDIENIKVKNIKEDIEEMITLTKIKNLLNHISLKKIHWFRIVEPFSKCLIILKFKIYTNYWNRTLLII